MVKLEFCFAGTTPAPPLLLFLLALLSDAETLSTFAALAAFADPPSLAEPNRPTPAVDRFVENEVLPNVELPVAKGVVPMPFPTTPNAGAEGTPIPPNEGVGVLETFGAAPKLPIPKPD